MKQWDAEWGRIGKEGHMWWLGSARKNWEATMGDKAWMWFCESSVSSFSHLSSSPSSMCSSMADWRLTQCRSGRAQTTG